ncbi:hypothetical protein WA171_007368 [Blastocystis sp. BT1]
MNKSDFLSLFLLSASLLLIWYCWFLLSRNYNELILNSSQSMIGQRGTKVEMKLSSLMLKSIGKRDLKLYATSVDLVEEQVHQDENVLSREIDSGDGKSETPSSRLRLNTPIPTKLLVSDFFPTRTVSVPSQAIPPSPSILSPSLFTPSVPSIPFISPSTNPIPSTSKPKRMETMYTRRNPNSSPRTPYNDILKNIQLKLPKRLVNESTFLQPHHLSYYSGSTHLDDSTPHIQPILSHSTEPDFTIISQSSSERLFFLPHLLERWHGSISIALFITEKEEPDIVRSLVENQYPSRLRITLYIHNSDSTKDCVYQRKKKSTLSCVTTNIYPINRLRNIAISNIQTTHFIVFDMDMWPAPNLYQELSSLPSSYLDNDYFVTIIPAFSFTSTYLKQFPCNGFQECVDLSIPLLPKTKDDLKECVHASNCSVFRPRTKTHNYVNDVWFILDPKSQLVYHKCFKERFMEPYVMVRRSETLPLFDERFINYGFNKVQWIEYLRYLGYEYYILSRSFAFDIPHAPSKYAKEYIARFKENPDMLRLYRRFLNEIRKKPDESRQLLCLSKYINLATYKK